MQPINNIKTREPLVNYIMNKIIDKIQPQKDIKTLAKDNALLMSAATALAIEAAALVEHSKKQEE